jgi:hypothetical protein
MQIKSIAIAAALVCSVGAASALTTQDFGSHTVAYDEATPFGFLSSSFTAGGGGAGFTWTVPNSAQVYSEGGTIVTAVALPSFTVTANAGWALSDIRAFIGNLVYFEKGVGATTGILIYADVSVDGGPVMSLSSGIDWVETGSFGDFRTGNFGQTFGPIVGGFTSIAVVNAHMDLSASGGQFSGITAQPQNRLEVSLVAMPVPEPQTYAMLLAGLGMLGWLARRRQA